MSSQRGNAVRTRPQRHQNAEVFRNDRHDTSALRKVRRLRRAIASMARRESGGPQGEVGGPHGVWPGNWECTDQKGRKESLITLKVQDIFNRFEGSKVD